MSLHHILQTFAVCICSHLSSSSYGICIIDWSIHIRRLACYVSPFYFIWCVV